MSVAYEQYGTFDREARVSEIPDELADLKSDYDHVTISVPERVDIAKVPLIDKKVADIGDRLSMIEAGILKPYIHEQGVASIQWNVIHNRNTNPQVSVVDSAGTKVEGTVHYTNSNELIIYFSTPFTGKAYVL